MTTRRQMLSTVAVALAVSVAQAAPEPRAANRKGAKRVGGQNAKGKGAKYVNGKKGKK